MAVTYSVISRMLDKEPMRRPAAVEILRETFIQQRMEVSMC